MKKKGQLTIFIIVGIVLLVVAGVYLGVKMTGTAPTQPVTQQGHPVRSYVESCIYNVAYEGLQIQGKQGGYIEIPDNIRYNVMSYLRTDLLGNIEYPYWYYDGMNNTPTLDVANNELRIYITKNLLNCLNFSGFKDYNVSTLRQYPAVEVVYAEQNTIIKVNYPLVVTDLRNGEVNKDLNQFQASIPVRFKKVFNAALAIMDAENKDQFLERKVTDLMAMAPEDEIPYTGIEFSCGRKKWYMAKIKDRLKGLIIANFPYIKFSTLPYKEDKYINIPGNDVADTYKNSYYGYHYVWDAGIAPDDNLRATIFFDNNFPFDMYADPSNGNVLLSNAQKSQGLAALMCINIWHFTYDINFPVIIRVKDLASNTAPEYVFEYGTKVMINHNTPDRKTIGRTEYKPSDVNYNEYCDELTQNDMTVIARDKATKLEIKDVNITFVCGFMQCNLGSTDNIANMGNIPALQTRAPQCVNAVLKADKKGYLEASRFGDINTEYPGTYTIEMTKVKDFKNIEVVKHMMVNDKDVSTDITPLSADETASVSMTIQDNPDYQSFATYPVPILDEPLEEDVFDNSLFSSNGIRIMPDDQITYHVSILVTNQKTEKVTAAYEGDWTPDAGDIGRSSKIRFHVVGIDSSDEYKDYLFMQGVPSYSQKVSSPELI